MAAPLLSFSPLLLLAGADAQAQVVERPPPGMHRVSLLLCDDSATCEEDAEWLSQAGLVDDEPLVLVDLLLELDAGGWVEGVDQRAEFEQSLARAQLAAERGRWPVVEASVDQALAALAAWPATVSKQELFELYFLQGAARLHRGEDRGHEFSLRQAAALVDGRPDRFPTVSEPARRAYIDELRKLSVAGPGTLQLTIVDPASAVFVDGRPIEPDQDLLELLPGQHRITAVTPGCRETWSASVPVLAERVSRLTVEPPQTCSTAWITGELQEVFTTLQAPIELVELLAGFCQRFDMEQLRLLHVQRPAVAGGASELELGPARGDRPLAAEGEEVDHGDGVPSTYEGQLVEERTAQQDAYAVDGEHRLQVAFFDPVTSHLHADGATATDLSLSSEQRLRLGVHAGYARLLDHHHAALDLVAAVRAGPLWAEGRLGVVRADGIYNLYPDWTDRHLYHVLAGARWAPREGWFTPVFGGGLELYVPAAWGGRAVVGAEATLGGVWVLAAEGHVGFVGLGLGWGTGASLARSF